MYLRVALVQTMTHFEIVDHKISLSGRREEILFLEFKMTHKGIVSDLFDDLEAIHLYIPSIKVNITLY